MNNIQQDSEGDKKAANTSKPLQAYETSKSSTVGL
jgi:hypothetical protein